MDVTPLEAGLDFFIKFNKVSKSLMVGRAEGGKDSACVLFMIKANDQLVPSMRKEQELVFAKSTDHFRDAGFSRSDGGRARYYGSQPIQEPRMF